MKQFKLTAISREGFCGAQVPSPVDAIILNGESLVIGEDLLTDAVRYCEGITVSEVIAEPEKPIEKPQATRRKQN